MKEKSGGGGDRVISRDDLVYSCVLLTLPSEIMKHPSEFAAMRLINWSVCYF